MYIQKPSNHPCASILSLYRHIATLFRRDTSKVGRIYLQTYCQRTAEPSNCSSFFQFFLRDLFKLTYALTLLAKVITLTFVCMSFIPVCVVPFTTRMFTPSQLNSEQNAVVHNIPEVTTRDCPSELLCKVEDVFEMLCTLDLSKASGPDGISGRMLKNTACSIAPALTKIFNLSISTGIVPDEWKLSHVVSIPKCNKYDEVSGYRPISLLSNCSKMLEKHVSHLLTMHLKTHCPLSPNQWGVTAKR